MSDSDRAQTLEVAVRAAFNDPAATVANARKLAGGTMHESWGLQATTGKQHRDLVVRVSPPGRADQEKMSNEYLMLKAMHARGVPVPRPYAFGTGNDGSCYLVMDRVTGDTNPRPFLTRPEFAEAREAFVPQLCQALAKIHSVRPEDVPGLVVESPPPGIDPVHHEIERMGREYRQEMMNPHPVIVWALGWCRREAASLAPSNRPVIMAHGDMRIGNMMYDEKGLVSILDWEAAHPSEPEDDLAWFCTRAWRFGRNELEAGGLTDRQSWIQAYEAASDTVIDRRRFKVWEVLRNIHWAIGCMMQARTHIEGRQRSHELAAIGRRAADTELEILRLTGVVGMFDHAG